MIMSPRVRQQNSVSTVRQTTKDSKIPLPTTTMCKLRQIETTQVNGSKRQIIGPVNIFSALAQPFSTRYCSQS